MLDWSLDVLRAVGAIEQIVVAMPAGFPPPPACHGVEGGATRSHSVRNALAAAEPQLDRVLVHDAARPLLSVELVERVLAACSDVEGAIAATPVTDTVKEGGDLVLRTLQRDSLWAVQTPQVFARQALSDALNVSDALLASATDDASLIERRGGRIRLVPAPRENLKVTTPLDLRLAELLLADREAR
jgi:2-C-methyl-D-erythritol 4-phosphate cytidylyltransferase